MDTRTPLTENSSYKEIFQRLSELTSPQICDALHPTVRVMKKVRAISGLDENDKCIGRAYTVDSNQDSLSTMLAIDDLQAFFAFLNVSETDIVPTILTIASCGAEHALVGGICAFTAKKSGFSGIVTDGFYRDTNEIKATRLPLFAKDSCPNSGSKDKVGQQKVPVQCGKVEVNPGDIIFADIDGVVVLNKTEALSAISKGTNIRLHEDLFLKKIESGAKFNELCNINEHVQNIELGIPSTLRSTF